MTDTLQTQIPSLPDGVSFAYRGDALYCEDLPVSELASRYGTPLYVYGQKAIRTAYQEYDQAFGEHPHSIMYSVKANSNLAIVNLLARLGAGFDVVSGGELLRVIAAGAEPSRVVFSGVGKTDAEITLALQKGIRCFNIESIPELEQIASIARKMGRRAPVSVRVNPNVDAKTHPYISTGLRNNKFGVAYEQTLPLYRHAAALPEIEITGIDCHIGSQITELSPFKDAGEKILDLVAKLAEEGIVLRHIDFGGGLGVRYKDETPPSRKAFIETLLGMLERRGMSRLDCLIEPGRSIVANAGILVCSVIRDKTGETKNFAVVDAAMNDMGRPMFYQAWMGVVPVKIRRGDSRCYDVVGPICESGDWLARQRTLCIRQGDLLAVTSAGAYGMSMSSNYNTRPRAAEVLVSGEQAFCIREREKPEDLWRLEHIPQP
ncbi:diaminopimelate decarboxylase [Mesosutterella sp. AGMB02718]|uniref:Diaminopimelate decarboxylase n=1 Tax=Mesosutterella faecium TaxID=2925194 RepID=A0ABT7IK32_9BURK|nr:diaminopimelate decarboxylase [Mesosutterella sp. AGMB02718]MDL2058729.1 diaminopimelate decarboxylase [Mesosutterella sp. AGMB02718]